LNEAAPIPILLVEDNPGDQKLAQSGFRRWKRPVEVHIAANGEEALDFLYRRGAFENAQAPQLIILDLNLPRINGREILQQIKNDPQLKHVPVCVLTGSKSPDDIRAAYGLQANCYMVKDVDFSRFMKVIQDLEVFWFDTAILPPAVPS
jgi:two-component system, chemotaxis family, response regulator Rcp1